EATYISGQVRFMAWKREEPRMPTENDKSDATRVIRLPRRARAPLFATFAGISALALLSVSPSVPVQAQLKSEGTSVQVPGRAPLSFADIVEKVKPAVVSVNVTNGEARVARNEERGGS